MDSFRRLNTPEACAGGNAYVPHAPANGGNGWSDAGRNSWSWVNWSGEQQRLKALELEMAVVRARQYYGNLEALYKPNYEVVYLLIKLLSV